MTVTLHAAGTEKPDPTPEDIAKALADPRDEHWCVTLWRGEDDFMEAMLDRGQLWLECEEGGRFLQATSHLDDESAQKMMVAFAEGRGEWRDLAAWREPPPLAKQKAPPPQVMAASAAVGAVFLPLVIIALVTGHGGWVGLAFALVFPGVIAIAVAVKKAEIGRAAKWTKGSARVVRSEWTVEKRHDKEVKVPLVEYDFTASFHRYRGRRVNFAEVVTGGDAKAVLARYPVGATVPVYYDPADPNKSVLERDPPGFFRFIYPVLGAIAAVILAVGLWLMLG